MKRIAWTNDIHLSDPYRYKWFCEQVRYMKPDLLLIGGDITEATGIEAVLSKIGKDLAPIHVYFVLGNHDFYGGSIAAVRWKLRSFVRRQVNLKWLSLEGIVGITERTCIIGHESWNDGRLGDYHNSGVELLDYTRITEFRRLNKERRLDVLNRLGDKAAAHFRRLLPEALARYQRVIVLTHVPPFEEARWHEGRICDANFLPHFGCKVVGGVLLHFMKSRPDRRMDVLCGHTHGEGVTAILPNLIVRSGGARYEYPSLSGVIDVA